MCVKMTQGQCSVREGGECKLVCRETEAAVELSHRLFENNFQKTSEGCEGAFIQVERSGVKAEQAGGGRDERG